MGSHRTWKARGKIGRVPCFPDIAWQGLGRGRGKKEQQCGVAQPGQVLPQRWGRPAQTHACPEAAVASSISLEMPAAKPAPYSSAASSPRPQPVASIAAHSSCRLRGLSCFQ